LPSLSRHADSASVELEDGASRGGPAEPCGVCTLSRTDVLLLLPQRPPTLKSYRQMDNSSRRNRPSRRRVVHGMPHPRALPQLPHQQPSLFTRLQLAAQPQRKDHRELLCLPQQELLRQLPPRRNRQTHLALKRLGKVTRQDRRQRQTELLDVSQADLLQQLSRSRNAASHRMDAGWTQ
jgi:hypothetical protein